MGMAASGGTIDKYPWGSDPIEDATDKANFWQGIFPIKIFFKMAIGEQHLWDLSHPMVMDYLTWLEMCGNGVRTNMM